jgi:hypothetical protein
MNKYVEKATALYELYSNSCYVPCRIHCFPNSSNLFYSKHSQSTDENLSTPVFYINKIRKKKGIANAQEVHMYIANKLLWSICLG